MKYAWKKTVELLTCVHMCILHINCIFIFTGILVSSFHKSFSNCVISDIILPSFSILEWWHPFTLPNILPQLQLMNTIALHSSKSRWFNLDWCTKRNDHEQSHTPPLNLEHVYSQFTGEAFGYHNLHNTKIITYQRSSSLVAVREWDKDKHLKLVCYFWYSLITQNIAFIDTMAVAK